MGSEPHRIYLFGEFRLDANRRLLNRTNSGEVVELTPKALELLICLVQHAGTVLEKQTLLDSVWPHVIVEENNLTRAISALRSALGEEPKDHRYIATIPGRGYRFVANVAEVSGHGTDLQLQSRLKWKHGIVIAGMGLIVVMILLSEFFDTENPKTAVELKITRSMLLSASDGSNSQAAFSPDGSRVVFVGEVSGIPQLFVQNLGRGTARQLTHSPFGATAPKWSAINDQVVYQGGENGIWSVDPMGTLEPRRLIENGSNPSLSSDGRKMIYESGNAIWTAEADGSGKRSLDHIPSANRFFARAFPSFSPNGEFIVYFQQAVGPMGDYWVIPATGGSPHQLTHDLQWGGKPAWTPDGHNVIFPSKRGGTITLWRVGMDGKNPEPVTTGLGQDAQPDVSADGQRLIYTSTRVEYFFMVTDPKTGKEEVLYRNRRAFYFPRVAPDGRSIAFFAEVEPREQIMLMHSDGHSLRQLTHYKSHEANIMPRWWPDGQSIIYYQNLRPASLRRLPLDGGPSETLLMEFDWELNMDAEPSPSGDRLAFVRTDPLTRERRVIIRRIETGDETQLDPAITHAPSWSADGSLLLGTGNDKVVVCPVTGSECRVVVDASNEAQSGLGFGNGKYGREARWSSDQSHIFYSRDTDEPGYFSLWRVKFDGSGDQQLFDFGPVHPLAHRFEVLPDDQILWGRYERSDSELVLAWISQNPSEP